MLRFSNSCGVWFRGVGWCGIAVALAFLGLSSCSNLATYRDDEFRDLVPSDYIRQVDPVNRKTEIFGVGERSQEIERSLGAGL
ncbi:MAG TPA: hypothetical protein VE890_16085 [Thermoguttaceae bacterium]|nr:hypothetical protein [Thermoguttaceae bacterium]